MLVRRQLETTTRLVVADNNQDEEEEEDEEEEDKQELDLDLKLKLKPEDRFNHQQLNASSRLTMNNWRTRRRTRNNNSSVGTNVSFSQSVTQTQSRHKRRHRSPSQRDASKAKLALAIFLCLACIISLASSNYAPQANEETASQCKEDGECGDMRCYQGRCMCKKEQPIENGGLCLSFSVLGETCSISEQCLGNSVCLDSLCSCGANAISLFNPSAQIYYCHPKRRLREECGHDAQCPGNSFCSTNKCLCQNGYGPVTVKNTDGAETAECLPKSCSSSRDCESEYHVCEDNRCICLADHFDPHTAECYKFGSTGGNKLSANNQTANAKGSSHDGGAGGHPDNANNNKGFNSILKDLMNNSDKLWYVIIILVLLTIILLALIVMSVRKYFLGYCWTAHKKEYEPNNRSAPKGGYFNKDSINNKSFRQKKGGEMDNDDDDDCDDNDDTAADRSNLVTTPTTTTVNKSCGAALLDNGHRRPIANQNNNNSTNKQPSKLAPADTENRYVKVDMRLASATHEDQADEQADPTNVHYQPYHQQLLTRPLSTSNSTAV